ncbi:MAG: hypothetical protein V4751_09925 [Pseudomonadota bacterium]
MTASTTRRWLLLLGLATGLAGCGFIMAPAQHGAAKVAQLSVKGADAGLAHGKEAAKIVTQTAISATQTAIDGLRPSTVRATQSDRQPGPVTRVGAP